MYVQVENESTTAGRSALTCADSDLWKELAVTSMYDASTTTPESIYVSKEAHLRHRGEPKCADACLIGSGINRHQAKGVVPAAYTWSRQDAPICHGCNLQVL